MAVVSDGSYGVPEGLISSFPVTTRDGSWEIVHVTVVSMYRPKPFSSSSPPDQLKRNIRPGSTARTWHLNSPSQRSIGRLQIVNLWPTTGSMSFGKNQTASHSESVIARQMASIGCSRSFSVVRLRVCVASSTESCSR